MKIKIRIPKNQLKKISPQKVYNKVGQKLRGFSGYIRSEIPNRTREGLDVELKPFKPLHPYTIARKGHEQPLFDTWEMMNSIQTDVIDNQHLHIDNPTEYHKFHVLGTKRMPKRDYFGISELDAIVLEEMMEEGMMELFGEWDNNA